jgi:hypothetical protein
MESQLPNFEIFFSVPLWLNSLLPEGIDPAIKTVMVAALVFCGIFIALMIETGTGRSVR